MATVTRDPTREQHIADQMLADLHARIPHVDVYHDSDTWVCLLSGPGWSTPYRGVSRYGAIDAAHATYYWPHPQQ